MNKNILEEYQKRVGEWFSSLEQRPIELQERIASQHEELQNRIEPEQNKLTEIISSNEVALMELQGTVNMDDVTYTESLGRRVVATKREEYSQDEEGKLLREFDIAVNDSAVTRVEIEQVIEALRKERERIRQERRNVLNKEIQDAKSRLAELEVELREGNERIALEEQKGQEENAKEAEATKNQLTDELKEVKREIEANIQRKEDNIGKKISEFNKAYAEGAVHKQALTLYKDSSSKVYTAAKVELEKCTRKAELAQTRVKRLTREIAHLEQDLGQVNGLLEKLDTSRIVDEVTRQEDETWEAYRAEQEAEKARQEEKKEREIDEAIRHKQEIEKGQEARADREAEDAVSQGYADGLNPEEEPIEPQEYRIPVEPKDPTKSQQPTDQKPKKPANAQPQRSQEPQDPKPKPDKWKVEGVAFSIEGGKNPVYKVVISNGKEQKEVTSNEIAVLDEDFDHDEIKTLTKKQKIQQADKFYDKGLAKVLTEVDVKYGTQSLKEYEQLLKDKEMIRRYPERYEDAMSISYDFSGLLVKPDENMKKLQDLAKANQRKGVVSEFKKRPNFIMRMIKRIFTKALPTAETSTKKGEKIDKETPQAIKELEAYMNKGLKNISPERIMLDWSELHTEPGFDIEEFVKDMPIEEADKYRIMQDKYKAGLEKDPYVAFRKKMQEEAEKGKQEEKVEQPAQAENTQDLEKDDVIEVEPKDVKVFDVDGREV